MGKKIRDTAEQIDKCLNCDKPKCSNCIDNPAPIRDKKEAAFMKLYNLGYGDGEIAAIMGSTRRTITQYRYRRKLEPNKGSNDTVLVVRCKYCKHRGTTFCPMETICEYPFVHTKDDDYCSYGERKSL